MGTDIGDWFDELIDDDEITQIIDSHYTLETLRAHNSKKTLGDLCVRCGRKLGAIGNEVFCGKCECELEKKGGASG